MMNKAVSGTIDESKILFGEKIEENSMIVISILLVKY